MDEHRPTGEETPQEQAVMGELQAHLRQRSDAQLAAHDGDADEGFSHLLERIDAEEPSYAEHSAGSGERERRGAPWWLVAAQAAAVAVLALTALLSLPESPSPTDPGAGATPYRVLADPQPAAGVPGAATRVRVVFAPTLTIAELQTLLERVDAQIDGGPNSAGAFTLRLPAPQLAGAVEELRSDRRVLLAEPVAPAVELGGPDGGPPAP